MPAEISNILAPISSLLIIALGLIVAYAITKFASYWQKKSEEIENTIENGLSDSKINWLTFLMGHLLDVVDAVVMEINDTVKKKILETSKDGKLTDEEKQDLLDTAITLVKEEIPEAALDELSEIVGDIDMFIQTKIENAVTNQKEYPQLSINKTKDTNK